MKRAVFGALLALFMMAAAAQCDEYTIGHATLTVQNGVVTRLRDENGVMDMDGICVDVGCDGAFVQQTIGYQRFYQMSTWDLAPIVPKVQPPAEPESYTVSHEGDTLIITHTISGLRVTQTYTALENAVRLSAQIESARGHVSEIQGVHFQLRGVRVGEGTVFRYPGNTPSGAIDIARIKAFSVVKTDYCNPIAMVRHASGAGFNALFLNTEEKWSTGVYRDRDGLMYISNLAMTEVLIHDGETLSVGSLYLQTTGADAYAPIQALYQELGYHAPDTGFVSGPVYSCHPAGTMDSGFRDVKTMSEYASSLPGLSAMGIESVWLLPIFEHTGRGVYEPTDQRLIDPRYGTDEDVRAYVESAHALGIRVLFDYVPHGPFPQDDLAQAHIDWCAVARDGQLQSEWDCVSFDMANSDYQRYTTDLVTEHVNRFHIDGGRVDCAMGGLTNWKPTSGNRPSSSSLKGGKGIVAAIRSGFERGGVTPTLLPENFHPVPFYADVTDIFYDMPLYRHMHETRQSAASEAEFASELEDFLEAEHLSSVPGQLKLRFLGNHDTVSWTWDQMRAAEIYGEEKAKALWSLMSLIDGVPFIYMGDENSDLYHFKAGYQLTDFFTALFAARKQYLSDDMDTEYLHAGGALIAFYRGSGQTRRLVLINLGKGEARYALDGLQVKPLYGNGQIENGEIYLPGYGVLLLAAPLH